MSEKDSIDPKNQPNDDEDFGLPAVNMTPLPGNEAKKPSGIISPPENADPMVEKKKPEKVDKKETNHSGWVILLVLLLLLLGGYGLYHFGIVGNNNREEETTSETTEETIPDPPAPVVEEAPALPEEEPIEEIKLTEITSRGESARYFVVVGSFIDDDLARDYSDRLNKNEMSTFLVHPYGNKNFYRLSVGQFDNLDTAINKMETLQGDFDENLWVLKY